MNALQSFIFVFQCNAGSLVQADPAVDRRREKGRWIHSFAPGMGHSLFISILRILLHYIPFQFKVLGGNSQNFLSKFVIFFETLGVKLLRL